MPPKTNPKNLNPLQLRTLAIFQRLAADQPSDADGAIRLESLPHPHGNHFHIGPAVIATRDATGLANPGVWGALERKGLIVGQFPVSLTLRREGVAYETGLAALFADHSDH